MTGEEFRNLRDQLGVTQQRLAELIGMSSGRAIREWESGAVAVPEPVALLVGAMAKFPRVKNWVVARVD